MQPYLRGKTYWIRFTHEGVQHRKPTGERTKTAALARGLEMLQALIAGNQPARKGAAPTLKEFAEGRFRKWVERSTRLEQKSRESYLYGLQLLSKQDVWQMRIDQIKTEDADMIHIGLSPSTHNCALRTLRRALNLAAAWDVIAKAPRVHLLEERRRTRLIEPDIEERISAVLNRQGARNGSLKTALFVILDTGMRPIEVARMRIEDVLFERGLIDIKASKTRAGVRMVPMLPRTKEKLFAQIGARTEGWVFPSPKKRRQGEHIQRQALTQAWKRASTLAGVSADVNLYCARHTFATEAMGASKNAFLVMKALGHTELSTTERYQHHEIQGLGSLLEDARNRRREVLN